MLCVYKIFGGLDNKNKDIPFLILPLCTSTNGQE